MQGSFYSTRLEVGINIITTAKEQVGGAVPECFPQKYLLRPLGSTIYSLGWSRTTALITPM